MNYPEKQVMRFEARIVEATSTFVRTLGVSWGMFIETRRKCEYCRFRFWWLDLF
jgi:type II secretory pathway component HofQ